MTASFKRTAVLLVGLTVPAAASAPERAAASITVADVVAPTMVLARLAGVFDVELVPRRLVDRLIRWRLDLRDLVHATSDRLAMLAERAGLHVPDQTILTTQPLGTSASTWATSGFGWREDPIRHRRKFHGGADVRARSGTAVFAAGDAIVAFAGRQGGYGNVVYLDHGGGVVTRYAHLRRIHVKKGETLTAGQRLGQVGSTGRATGPHLHFEVRLDGRPVDPGTAMTVAELSRENVAAGQLAAFALSPEMQAHVQSDLDPPRTRRRDPRGPRPERRGRTKRARPLS